MTTVYNLNDHSMRMEYSLPPEDAVRAAHGYSTGNHNTWTYDQYNTIRGAYSVMCGEWAALLNPDEWERRIET